MLKGKKIILGVTGSIAAYKSAQIIRLLVKEGAEVKVIMTELAKEFITPLTLATLAKNPILVDFFDPTNGNWNSHVDLGLWADAYLIAPATANTMAKCSHGLADNLVSTLYLAATCPVFMAPAMNQAMWNKPVTQENIQRLIGHGVTMIGPEPGEQACGETGMGRMSEPAEICRLLLAESTSQCLKGLSVLISAGPTREPLDPVRYLTNRSSGKMGYALAKAALKAGAKVTLVSGPVSLTPPAQADVFKIETAEQMYEVVITKAVEHDIYIGAAAVADYRPVFLETHKIKKSLEKTTLTLQKNHDILADVAMLSSNRPFTVGFAAETHDLERYAQDKLIKKNLDMIAANWVGQDSSNALHNESLGGFDSDQNALQVFWNEGQKSLAMTDKNNLAEQLIGLIAERMELKSK